MVKLQVPTLNAERLPMMFRHSLKVIKPCPNFEMDETVSCFIAKYDGGRYAVWDSTWKQTNKYHVFNSEQELHDTFEEFPG